MPAPGGTPAQPTGAARLPPPWLADHPLPLVTVAAGEALHRIHRTIHGAIFFGPGRGAPPTYRFDSASGRFGVLYVGTVFDAAFVETLLRNPHRRSVRLSDVRARSSCIVNPSRELRVVKTFDEGLSALGTDNAISTGPYEPCGVWSDALWDHRDRPDGIAYRSRHDPALICIAIFERDKLRFSAGPSSPLMNQQPVVGALLDRYGKSIENDEA